MRTKREILAMKYNLSEINTALWSIEDYMRKKETPRLRVGTDDPNTMAGTQEAQIKKVLDRFANVSYNIYKGLKKYPLTYDSFK